jgi:hypothetical protein
MQCEEVADRMVNSIADRHRFWRIEDNEDASDERDHHRR